LSTQAERGAGESDVPRGEGRSTRRGRGTASKAGARAGTRGRRTPSQAFEEAADSEPTRPRTGARRTLTDTVRELPNYLRLLWGLMWDRRVPQFEKVLVGGAIAYILMPLDWIPDFIPFFGEIDDVFLLVMSLQRLVQTAGRRVLLDHWAGDPAALEDMNMVRVVAAAAFFLPRRIRRRLRAIGRL
jgi:uncharacterized membrane protein YkvA (DUF1232 family)